MIEVERLLTIIKDTHMSATAFGRMINLSHTQMSKILNGAQKIPVDAVGEIIHQFKVHPNWIFGFEGQPDKVMYMHDYVHKSKIEELESELAAVYKKLAISNLDRLTGDGTSSPEQKDTSIH